jgi:hypothetical protein
MKIEKEKYMNAALVILQGLLASGKYNENCFSKQSHDWEPDPIIDALNIADDFFSTANGCRAYDDFFEVK